MAYYNRTTYTPAPKTIETVTFYEKLRFMEGNKIVSRWVESEMGAETRRVIFKCKRKSCKHVWAYDYHVGTENGVATDYWFRFDLQTGKKIRLEDDTQKGCTKCGCISFNISRVVGTYSETHKCGAKCLGATGPSCDCQCGGKNHGKNHL